MSDGHPKLIPIDKETNHQIVHAFRPRKADRPADQPLNPRAQVDVLALDLGPNPTSLLPGAISLAETVLGPFQ